MQGSRKLYQRVGNKFCTMKRLFSLAAIAAVSFISFLQFESCTKESVAATVVCDVKATYSGTSLASTGTTGTLTYILKENNLAVGRVTPGGADVTFGGYSNTCDSLFLSVYYTTNSSYYILKGKIAGNVISGTFNNLTIPSQYGTFTMTK